MRPTVNVEEIKILAKNSNDLNLIDAHAMSINLVAETIHEANRRSGWWTDLNYEKRVNQLMDQGFDVVIAEGILKTLGFTKEANRNVGELLCLVHSEVSEAMEGHRKNLMDDKLPHRKMVEVELADAVIRIFDMAAGMNMDIGSAIIEKYNYNQTRADHRIENRMAENGKKY